MLFYDVKAIKINKKPLYYAVSDGRKKPQTRKQNKNMRRYSQPASQPDKQGKAKQSAIPSSSIPLTTDCGVNITNLWQVKPVN